MTLRFELLGNTGGIRRGRYHTPHGTFETPCFAPVGTCATVNCNVYGLNALPAVSVAAAPRNACTNVPAANGADGMNTTE